MTIYDKDEVNFYNVRTTKITILADAVLKGWQCPHMNLWSVPLVPFVTNLNTGTLVLDHLSGQDSLNHIYTVKTNPLACNHVVLQMCKNHRQEYLHNVCMNSPASNQPFGTSMARPVPQQKPPG